MKTLVSTAFFALLMSAPLSAVAGKPKVVATDVCSVLGAPETFVNQVIRLRGFVYLGEDHMNVSSIACPGQGIELVIKSDQVVKQNDVHHFYVQMNHQGRKGVATITGLFQADKDPLTPYVLNIQHVKDVGTRTK
jgi:hypothetical protein